MNTLDAALLQAWDTHITPCLTTPAGRAELTRRFTKHNRLAGGPKGPASPTHVNNQTTPSTSRPLRSFTLVLRANDRRLHDNNTAGAVPLDPDEIQRLCAPIPLEPPGLPRASIARRLGVSPQALSARIKQGHLIKHHPFSRPSTRSGKYPGDPPRSHAYFYAPPPTHLIHPIPEVQSADWGTLTQSLHQRPQHLQACGPQSACPTPKTSGANSEDASEDTSGGGAWSQTLHRTVRQLHPNPESLPPNSRKKYERFEWQCPDCGQHAQRLYWPFRPMTLPAYLRFDFHQLAPELPPQHIAHLTSQIEHQHLPFTKGFTCRQCLKQQFGGQGLTYESTEFTAHHGHATGTHPKNTWHRFIQRLSMGMLHGDEVLRTNHL
ncbi:hypothetical protein [Algisphaera agarilytica]|uniref:Uncharacterized protein n=1 Tax=Algisphaera agarilytica TaxID=1385975 RepID=A0A7X0HA21_9BACT|nr:hypothetical protein [Algisphaera agarilytica]MBB6430600.1 hypothetical protein [Algisphaera agarilytica]